MPAIERQEEFDDIQRRARELSSVKPSAPEKQSKDNRSLVRATRAELLAHSQALVLAIMAELLAPKDLERALDAFVGALHHRFKATRVVLALVSESGALELGAISQQALVELASNEVRLLLDVMEECLDHENVVCFPDVDTRKVLFAAHYALGTRRNNTSLVTVPLYRDEEAVGVLLIERHHAEPFVSATIELLKHIAAVSAPTVSLRREAQCSAYVRAKKYWYSAMTTRFGAGRFGTRLLCLSMLAMVVLATLAPVSRSVTADAELVPRERRLVTAPFDGFVDNVVVEPGQSVIVGQLLAQLEQRELELEGTRRDGEIASAEAEFRSAMASHDRQATAVARARLERERTLRAMVAQRLERIELRAPIAGLIVNGDPADIVGAPVTRGETLFEIALADGYEVHLMVHERDIREIQIGQHGSLSLRARPGEELELLVHTIHPVAESNNGASRFRVRATIEVPTGITLRPGESGVAKLDAGQTNLVYLLSRPIGQRLTELWWRFSR